VKFSVIIPARYASTRLPGKPLLDIGGKPMLQRVYEQATGSGANRVVIATDDARIKTAAGGFGAEVVMTSSEHTTGTDRLAEAVKLLKLHDDEIIVNVQGDEPLMPGRCISQVAEALHMHGDAQISTLCVPITSSDELFDYHVVKVVRDADGYALYFSRAPIPWDRDEFAHPERNLAIDGLWFRHVGLYGYVAGFLETYTRWPSCIMEQRESLEQLRVLWHGGRIIVVEAAVPPGQGVDTAADLEKVRRFFDD
jgi:3-deoxy-manno-octulosonate cytidylyltransferase (CMP-KDO synthetase)